MKYILRPNFLLCLFIAVSIFGICIFNKREFKSAIRDPAKRLYFAPPAMIRHFTFGYTENLADGTWLRVLQDIDVCEQKRALPGAPRVGPDRISDCEKGWVFHMVDLILEIAPRWRLPAAVGPLLLSVIVDDREGATIAFRKAVRNFPDDWPILFRAAYHFLYETNEHLYAAQLYDRAGNAGAPAWVHSLAAKLYSESGRNQVALIVVKDALVRAPEGAIRRKLEERLAQIEAKIKSNAKAK